MSTKKVVILGSTGSIGINTLDVIRQFPQRFEVFGLTAYNNLELLERQIKEFSPRYVAVPAHKAESLRKNIRSGNLKILDVEGGLDDLVSLRPVDIVVIAMRGSAALKPFLKAVRSGKIVAPANKEALVVAGDILLGEAKRCGATVIPIDSEQSAIFQCLNGRDRGALRKVYLTASGGALLNVARNRFDQLKVADILSHPRWKMGKKITVDSATLMNKGFEVIEATRLFGLSLDQIEVVVHPEAIVHSMVEFQDGSILAQLSVTDMRLPIQYALTYPERIKSSLKPLDLFKVKQLNFQRPDHRKFPSLALAMNVARRGGTLPSVLNAADEIAVEAFLDHQIAFTDIYRVVERVVSAHKPTKNPSLEQIIASDQWAREQTVRFMKGRK